MIQCNKDSLVITIKETEAAHRREKLFGMLSSYIKAVSLKLERNQNVEQADVDGMYTAGELIEDMLLEEDQTWPLNKK